MSLFGAEQTTGFTSGFDFTHLRGKIKKMNTNGEMLAMFSQYKSILDEENQQYSEIDFFIAGWILANPIVREKFNHIRLKEIDFDTRISNIQ